MSSTTSPRVPTRLLTTLEDKSLGILSPITGELLEVCYLPAQAPSPSPSAALVTDDSVTESGTFITEGNPLHHPTMKAAVYIPSEGFIYCLDESGDIYVFITCGM